ncbi:MAG: ATPase component BioM of energizing module of biotin ECF transporter [uncultured Sulfurovum sp.]|uniref:ATPase component BioM of energizing module of biotin ECF transporter n=1 Tax=uncultured Sulfurovum sp. TaxID=269237 RepID=A0A6S6SH64_9BACT|nr:MAG: ATPase component BioM of energizing module of biotin ECF transporter [uncultured Sulfurovum sp.]
MILEELRNYQFNYLELFNFTYKRYLHREVDFEEKLIGIVGARGVGKTTFLLQYLNEHSLPMAKKLYFSADAIDVESLFDIAYEFHKVGGELLIIDEIHKYNNFEKELKKIYDMLKLKVIFSGSSALKLDHSKGDLSRRARLYQMKGLSFREFIEIKNGITLASYGLDEILKNHTEIAHKLLKEIKPYEYWQEYLKNGYYPFYFENPKSYQLRLKETINTVIEVDIPSIFPIDYEKIINLKKLVRLVCESQPFQVNIKELSTNIGVKDYQTLYRYLEYLRRGKILNLLRAKSRGDTIFAKPQKLYLGNTNLHYAYCNNANIGTIQEVFVMSMIDEDLLEIPSKGDFRIADKYLVEVGGKNKSFKQIKDIPDSFVLADDIEVGFGSKVPLWLFGFLY